MIVALADCNIALSPSIDPRIMAERSAYIHIAGAIGHYNSADASNGR
jgi:hypothetical protein